MQKIELSFCSDLGKHSRWTQSGEDIRTPPTGVNFDALGPGENARAPENLSTPVAPSDYSRIRLGEYSVLDVVKHHEQLLGCKLNYNIRQVGDTTKVFLEMAQAQNSGVGETSSGRALTAASTVLDWGGFDITKARTGHTITHPSHDLMFIKLSPKFCTPPTIILGLSSLEADSGANTRIKTYVDRVHEHIFCAHIHSWFITKLYRASFNWLALPSNDPYFQAGSFDTAEDDKWSAGKDSTHCKIDFPHSYEIPPTIVVWLNNLDLCRDHHEHIMAFATDITTTGFTVHINCLGDTTLYYAQVSWFAYPTGYPGIHSGNVLMDNAYPTGYPVDHTWNVHMNTAFNVVKFDRKFEKPPTGVLVGLSKVQTDKSGPFSFDIITEAVSEFGMGIRAKGWSNTILHSAGVAYIAIE